MEHLLSVWLTFAIAGVVKINDCSFRDLRLLLDNVNAFELQRSTCKLSFKPRPDRLWGNGESLGSVPLRQTGVFISPMSPNGQ